MANLQRLFLDTNIFIIGDANKNSAESLILESLGYRSKSKLLNVEVILSDELLDQIHRVAKYGLADCFVSGNRELIKIIADFECLTADAFVNKYLS